MAWTYDLQQLLSAEQSQFYPPATVGLRNQIRFVLQDTDPTRPLLQDEEIDWIQTQEANQYMMAAACAETLVARQGNLKSKNIGPLQASYDAGFYRGLAARLRARGMTYQVPYVGGISIADKLAQEDDGDWVPPAIFRGIFDNTRATQPTPGSAGVTSLMNPNLL